MNKIPLYLQIVAALIVAVIVGILLGAGNPILDREVINHLALPSTLILKALRQALDDIEAGSSDGAPV